MYPEYRTTDIILAAFLKFKGYTLNTIEKQGKRGEFVFANVLLEDIRDYDLGLAKVEPIAFNGAIKQLTTSVRRLETK